MGRIKRAGPSFDKRLQLVPQGTHFAPEGQHSISAVQPCCDQHLNYIICNDIICLYACICDMRMRRAMARPDPAGEIFRAAGK